MLLRRDRDTRRSSVRFHKHRIKQTKIEEWKAPSSVYETVSFNHESCQAGTLDFITEPPATLQVSSSGGHIAKDS